MSEQVVQYCPPVTSVDHYLEATSRTKRNEPHVKGLLSMVNDSLFCAHVRFLAGKSFVAEYPAHTLIVYTIWGNQERDGLWRHRIRLEFRAERYDTGFNDCGEVIEFKVYPETNYQIIFRSSLIWTIGYHPFATASGHAIYKLKGQKDE